MTVRKQAITVMRPSYLSSPPCHLRNNASNHELEIFLVIEHQLSKQTHFLYFAAMVFHGMIKPDLEQILWPQPLSHKVSEAKFYSVFQLCLLF